MPQPPSTGKSAPALEIAHVLFMDIVAYSTLTMEQQTQIMGQLQAIVRDTAEFKRAQKRRQLLTLPTGDGMALVFFGDPEAPARCAVEISRALRNSEIELRMGIHTGPVQRVEDINAARNVSGGGINMAQRVMDCGDAGHVLVSRAAADVMGETTRWNTALHDLGEVEVKHGARVHLYNLHTETYGNPKVPGRVKIQREHRVETAAKAKVAGGPAISRSRWMVVTAIAFLSVGLALGILYMFSGVGTRLTSVAVLPFANQSGDPSMEYLTDGITDGIIDRLSGLPNIKVISRTSAFHYKGREIEPPKVAKELGVRALVTGRVMQHGNQLSVNAELVDATEDKQLWGEQYSRTLADIALLQQEIARAISGNLRVRLSTEEKVRLAKSEPETNPEAYQLYLKGRYSANQGTAEAYRKAIDYYRESIALEPGTASAYAGLANAYDGLGGGLIYASPSETLPKAKAAALKAMELDDTLSEGHAALAYAEWFYDLNWMVAEREFQRAIELNPNSSVAHLRYAECLITRARFNEGIAEGEKAQKLDPLSPMVAGALGYIYMGARQYDRSISQQQKALELDPEAPWLHALLAWAYAAKNMYPRALAEYDKIPERQKAVSPENQLVADGLGWLYAISGRRNDALKVAKQLEELSSHAYVDLYQLGTIYAGLGDKENAFRLLEQGFQQHSASIPYLAVDPFWQGIQSDPRFSELKRRVGLPQ